MVNLVIEVAVIALVAAVALVTLKALAEILFFGACCSSRRSWIGSMGGGND